MLGTRFTAPIPVTLALASWLSACRADTPQVGASDESAAEAASPSDSAGRLFERGVVFLGSAGDSTVTVPWLFTAHERTSGVDRQARGWLGRGGRWESFLDEQWRTEPTRAPWRLQPRRQLRLIVGGGDVLQGLVFADGPRQLEVALGATLAQWTSSRGGTFLVAEGATVLAGRRMPGLVLDLTRAHRRERLPPGDWMFLVSGDSVQMVLTRAGSPMVSESIGYEAWAKLEDGREIPWRDVNVSWIEMRAFERARRDVPVRWRVIAGDGELAVELERQTAQIETGTGSEPRLPIEALFEVAGTLRVSQVAYPVRGFVRHVQN